ncbi:MAG: hypothetical protein ABR600_13045 [Actinomycetota bacterium]
MKTMKRLIHSEDGFTMFTAVMLSAIVFVLAAASTQISQHNLQSSGEDRRRFEAITAAEAGVDYYYSQLAATPQASLPCSDSGVDVTQTLAGPPATTFSVDVTYYDTGQNALTCSQVTTGSVTPGYVQIVSTGKPSGLTRPTRKMQAYVRLTPNGSGAFPAAAIMGQTSLNLAANVQVFGSSSNNADLYTNGNFNLASNSTNYGNVYAQGSATMSGNSVVKGSLWANTAISMSGKSSVGGSATSSTSTITLTASSHVYGDAKAGGTITAGAGAVSGSKYPNTSGIGVPPQSAYPTYTLDSSKWTGVPYNYVFQQVNTCAAATTALNTWVTGNLLLQLTGLGGTPCTWNPPTKILPGSLAIYDDGPMTFNTRTFWTALVGPYNVHLFVGMAAISGYCNFQTNSNSGIGPNLNALIYVPSNCTATLNSNSSLASGQVFGGTVNFNANTSFKYNQVTIPGTTNPGFLEDVLYKREIV